ncbi:MAG: T9SS type A sorting domain-containing protein [Saprospiraceae bacterium]|nr:T9SS type A sorting domain-containing protein [Saprospiraceae bacterium]
MKNLFLLFILFFSINIFLVSQTTFNKGIDIMKHINQSGPIILFHDTLLCLGNGVDHDTFDYYAVFMSKIDLNGNFLKRYIDIEPQRLNVYNQTNNAFVQNDSLLVCIDSNGNKNANGYLMIYRIGTGEILKKIPFISQTDDTAFLHDMIKINDSIYAVLLTIQESLNSQYADSQICIINIKTDSVKYVIFGKKDISDSPTFLHWTGSSFLVGTGYLDPPFIIGQYIKRNIEGIIYEVDLAGNFKIVHRTDSMRGPIFKLFKTKLGEYICTSHYGKHYQKTDPNNFYPKIRLRVFKLNKNFVQIWEKPWSLDFEIDYYYKSTNIIETQQQDGYLLAGYQVNYAYNLTEKEIDSLWQNGIALMTVGILEKINEDGERQWLRSYSLVSNPEQSPNHELNDIIYSPDGGYYMYGTLRFAPMPDDSIGWAPTWLLKVDQYGCLVPGCQNGDTVSVTEETSQNELLIYPNPSSDVLFIYDDKGGESKYTIADIKGNAIRKWSGNLKDHTYIVQLHDFSPGVYIVSRVDDGGRMRSGKFVKGR